MAQQTDLAVRIATIFDAAGLNKADKAVGKLQKSTSKLGRTLGVSLGAAAIVAFGRQAVRAFNEDAKAAARLNNVVRNLGLSFEQANVEGFISSLEKSASIADDSLRPAFQALLTTTGSVTEAQKLLTTAIEASRGSGFDLTSVAEDLSRAYTGNTRGLQKYYLGLSKAQLASMTFEEIQAKINKTFEGANSAYLNTAAGKMEAISIATGNYAETVGGALVDALITATGSNGVEGLVDKIDSLAQSTANSIVEFQKFAFITRYALNPKNLFKGGDEFTSALNAFTSGQQMAGASPFNPQNNSVTGYKLDEKAAKDAKKAADIQAKLLKQSIENQKKLTAERKKQEALKKAGSIFDLEQVQLIAALKGKLSDEDRKKVELQLALLTGNTKQVKELTYEIARAQGLSEELAKYLASLPDAKNPFASWDAYLDKILEKAQKAANTTSTTNTAVAVSNIVNKSNVSDPALAEYGQSLVKNNVFDRATTVPSMPATNVSKLPSSANLSQFGAGPYLFPSSQQNTIVVEIDGKQISSSQRDSSLSGISSSVNRLGR